MKSIAISGSLRKNVGKTDARDLRYEGKAPCVLYGGKDQTHFSVLATDLKGLVYTPEAMFVDLNIDGKKHRAIMQDIQFHPVTDNILHIDFLELDEKKPLTMGIPVKFEGTSPGVKTGGKLVQKLKRLTLRGLPANFIDEIVISIEKLELGKSIRVEEVTVKNLEILNSKADTIVSVVSSRALKEAGAEAPAAS